MQMTHAEARKLIQLNADEALNVQEKIVLSVHLKDCPACRAYAEQIKEVENILAPLLRRQWNLQPIPFPVAIAAIRVKRNLKARTNILLATRKAAIGVVVLAFVFSAWQFALSDKQGTSPLPVGILPVPTPSTQSTTTTSTSQSCNKMLYTARK